MSNRPRRRRARPNREVVARIAELGARMAGCTCKPEIRLRHGDLNHLTLAHDQGCPALRGATVFLAAPVEDDGDE